jgi:hypothetical protein
VPVDAVDARVQLAADPPFEVRRVGRVEDSVPLLVPVQELGVLDEAVREVLLGEPLPDRRVVRIRLLGDPRRRVVVLLLPPVDGDLRLGNLDFGGH